VIEKARRKAVLVLEDGSVFEGVGFGASREVSGEVVFNTGMVGYPESMTDPSYHGQILTFTYPLIGNYGVPSYDVKKWGIPEYFESDSIKVEGIVVAELCKKPSHWLSTKSLEEWLIEENIPGIEGVDTRELTKKLRIHGVMLGILKVCEEGEEPDIESLLSKAEKIPDPNERNLVKEVSIEKPIFYDVKGKKTVALLDCGVKYNIIRSLLKRGVNVVRLPFNSSLDEILSYNPSGVLLSNGPGDPKKIPEVSKVVQGIVELNIPTLGICLGNQLLALALGGDTYKLKYGHRSQNQPCVDENTGRCYITSQNHGYSVKVETLPDTGLEPWFTNVNDHTNEGLIHSKYKALAVQFHPENHPGPVDTEYVFDIFVKYMEEYNA